MNAEDSALAVPSQPGDPVAPNALAALRRFARPRPPRERCDLCANEIPEVHPHLFAPADRQLSCACNACAILFSGGKTSRYQLVPQTVESWSDFRISDVQWTGLNIPINLAFFTVSSVTGNPVAYYPSPAGATEASLDADSWAALLNDNPRMRELENDVEALLAYRIGPAREYFRAPIDECYRLVGLIRANWRGLSGGAEVWRVIAEFFQEMKIKSNRQGHPI